MMICAPTDWLVCGGLCTPKKYALSLFPPKCKNSVMEKCVFEKIGEKCFLSDTSSYKMTSDEAKHTSDGGKYNDKR